MDAYERIKTIQLINNIKKHPKAAKKAGLKDSSKFSDKKSK